MAKVVEHERFKGIYWVLEEEKRKLATKNLVPGFRSYNEQIVEHEGREYRIWSPLRSKPAAAIVNGLKIFPIRSGSRVLYLGIASGTTASHFSDIIGPSGVIYGIEISDRPLRELIKVCETRRNIVPIMGDARKPDEYSMYLEQVDVVYADVAQPFQAQIIVDNAVFLKDKGHVMLAIKASSIDATKPPDEVFSREVEILEEAGFKLKQIVRLEPYERKHALVVAEL